MQHDDDLTDADRDARYAARMRARAIRQGAPDPDGCDDDAPDEYPEQLFDVRVSD